MALVDEHYVFAYAKHAVHIVGVDNGGYIVFVGDVAQKFVDQYRCLGVES